MPRERKRPGSQREVGSQRAKSNAKGNGFASSRLNSSETGSQSSQLNSDGSSQEPQHKRQRISQLRKIQKVVTARRGGGRFTSSLKADTPRSRRSGGRKTRGSNGVDSRAGKGQEGCTVDSDDEEDELNESDSSTEGSQTPSSTLLQKKMKRRADVVKEVIGDEETGMPMATLVENTLTYLLVRQNRILPFSRVELTREAMSGQRRDVPLVIKQVQKILKDSFLMELVGFEKAKSKLFDFDSYILISRLPLDVAYGPGEREINPVRNFLVLALSAIYIGGVPLDAGRLLAMLYKMKFEELCPEEENFDKFLRNEYVSKQFLDVREFTKAKGSPDKFTYEWGLRSHYEFSKMAILRNIAPRLGVMDIKSMSYAYGEAKKQIEKYGTIGAGSYGEYESDEESDSEFENLRNSMAELNSPNVA